jgi:hypothetical protein
VDQVVASCIRSLRALEATDCKVFFEEVSETEQILRRDPAGVYARMEFDSRDRYRKVVEDLASRSGRPEEDIAVEAVRAAQECGGGRAAHVGIRVANPRGVSRGVASVLLDGGRWRNRSCLGCMTGGLAHPRQRPPG